MSQTNYPPKILVKTWLHILSSADEKEARVHAKKMLDRVFGNVEFAIMYLEGEREKIRA